MIEGDATIEFNNLSFHYPNRPDVPVLKNFNLKAPPGSVIAMVGASGSGKSTLASLITRLYDPDDNYQHDFVGEEAHRQNYESHRAPITINGTDIRKIDPYYLRRMISVVPQDPVLFRGTIRDNIRYGQWDLISDDDVLEAAHSAFVLDFALNFPDGLDTLVGPRGMQLSGGQRQVR
jgi:ABC-type multidrug transport system fused ATPase/permease subunit